MAEDQTVARIRPFNPNIGQKMQNYTHHNGMRFREAQGWYLVSAALGRELAELYQDEEDPTSPKAFDVMTKSEAMALEQAEKKRAERATSRDPNQTRGGRDVGRRDVQGAVATAEAQAKTASVPPPRKTEKAEPLGSLLDEVPDFTGSASDPVGSDSDDIDLDEGADGEMETISANGDTDFGPDSAPVEKTAPLGPPSGRGRGKRSTSAG